MRIGSLFSGYGGLDMGVQTVVGGEVAWHVEFDDAPSRILEHHFPGVPNYGDITKVDWGTVPPVDILTGGFPCQDLSIAGRRAGMRAGTRSGLWSDYLKAIRELRPSLVVIENVRGLLSGCAESDIDSEVGPCPRCAGTDSGAKHAPNVRALGRVLLDLAAIGYDARWDGVQAADAGAPHERFRVFVIAHPYRDEPERGRGHRQLVGAASSREGNGEERERFRDAARYRGSVASHSGGVRGGKGNPTSERGAEGSDRSGVAVERGPDYRAVEWGDYRPAIERWELILGRPAPFPRESERISAKFTEWMMGLPEGWVTGVGLGWNAEMKALGNGVVPQQAALAIRTLLETA